jgi:1-deoxy-D-xylulose-5-phosphate reductoisomerase
MRGPIHQALHHPERRPSDLRGFDLRLFRQLSFDEVDPQRFPGLELGYAAVRSGGNAGATLNAADEVAVEAFLEHRIDFQDIVRVDRKVLDERRATSTDVDGLLAADRRAREEARRAVEACALPHARA